RLPALRLGDTFTSVGLVMRRREVVVTAFGAVAGPPTSNGEMKSIDRDLARPSLRVVGVGLAASRSPTRAFGDELGMNDPVFEANGESGRLCLRTGDK